MLVRVGIGQGTEVVEEDVRGDLERVAHVVGLEVDEVAVGVDTGDAIHRADVKMVDPVFEQERLGRVGRQRADVVRAVQLHCAGGLKAQVGNRGDEIAEGGRAAVL